MNLEWKASYREDKKMIDEVGCPTIIMLTLVEQKSIMSFRCGVWYLLLSLANWRSVLQQSVHCSPTCLSQRRSLFNMFSRMIRQLM
jgi:hypothetical protein